MKKRIVSLLMAVLMLVTMLPVTAMAEELTTTDPTEEQVVSGETTPDTAEEPETPDEPEEPNQPGEPEEPTQPTVPQEPEQPTETELELPEFPEVLSQEAYITPVKDANAPDPCDSFEWKEIGDGKMPFMYNDGMLFDDARSLSTDIAKASIILADRAYAGKDEIGTMLKSMGYECLDNSFSYGRTVDIYSNDVVAYTIAYKDVTYQGQQYRLYCVPVRGTMKNSEWYSNFNIGTTGDHEGFHKAASEVYAQLATELMDDGIDAEHSLVWLTGHSRGAAVANIVAGMLNKNTVQCTPRHIFAYTFACPAIGKKADTSYTNIYNFNNPGDLITAMPLEEWGYKRNGQTIELPMDHLDNLRQRFQAYVGTEYKSELTTDNYEKLLKTFFPSEASTQQPFQKLLLLIGGTVLGGKTDTDMKDIISYSGYSVGSAVLNEIIENRMSLLQFSGKLTELSETNDSVYSFVSACQQEVQNMTEEEFPQFCSEHKDEIDALEKAALIEIDTLKDFKEAVDRLIECIGSCNQLQDVFKAAEMLWGKISDALNEVMTAITHGHQQETYILWINSMYGGCCGWYGNQEVTSMTMPETRTISSGAFYNCSSLTNIKIPDIARWIGESAFYNCSGLTSVTIPNVVKTIGDAAFYGCSGLQEVTLSISAEYRVDGRTFNDKSLDSFAGCENVQKITYTVGDGSVFNPTSTTTSGSADTLPYYAYKTLTTVVYEEGISEVPDRALYRYNYSYEKLTSVTLPSTVKKIGEQAFRDCPNLADIVIPKGVESIGAYAFYNCSSLKEIDISNLTEISAYAFYNCSGLTSVTIPNAVTKIDTNAFYGCSGLKEVTLPISAEYRVDGKLFNYKSLDSFAGCGNVQKITYTVGNGTVFAHGQKYTLPGYARSALTTVVYEEGIPEIPEYALNNCSKVTTVTLPSTVTKIGNYAFYSCTSLPSIAVPECTKSIGDFAFYGCSSLESTGSLKNVGTIGAYAFYNCSSLKEIDISNLTEISGYTFYNCSGLTSVRIPDVVKTIGDAAFYGCSGLTEVTLPISAQYRVEGTFNGRSLASFADCENIQKIIYTVGDGSVFAKGTLPRTAGGTLTTVVYEEGISEIPEYALNNCSKVTSVALPSTVKKIGAQAFRDCPNLADIVIPKGVESIGAYAFYNCSSLKEIDISNLTEISAYAFYNCSGLTSVTIPNAVTKIDTNAFYGCSGLKEVTLPISAEYRVDGKLFNYKSLDSFAGCGNVQKITYTVGNGTVFAHGQKYTLPGYARSALTTVVYEEGIPEIPEYALNNCSKVTSVTLPSTVTKIGTCAFNGCSGLADVYYLDREPQWENVKANTATGNTPLLNARIHFVQDGDINGSFGAPDVNDVQCLYTYLASGDILGAYKNNAEMFTSLADVNMDSTVDVYDLQLLYETVSGIV